MSRKHIPIIAADNHCKGSNDVEGALNSHFANCKLQLILYPEILPSSTLITHLKERLLCATSADLYSQSKELLVDLYYKLCVPRPQRIYSEHLSRGRILNHTRKLSHSEKSEEKTIFNQKRQNSVEVSKPLPKYPRISFP